MARSRTRRASTSVGRTGQQAAVLQQVAVQRDLRAPAPDAHEPGPGYLVDCARLKPRISCDTVYLSQVMPLIRRLPGTCDFGPVTLPTIELGKLCPWLRDPKHQFAKVSDLHLYMQPDIRATGASYGIVAIERAAAETAAERSRSRGAARAARTFRLPTVTLREEVRDRVEKRLAHDPKWLSGALKQRLPDSASSFVGGLAGTSAVAGAIDEGLEVLQGIVASLPLPVPNGARAGVGFEAIYRQEWCLKEYRRGRLIRSIPLTADGRKEIGIKSWTIRKDRREMLESIERDISNEVIGDEKWSHATTKQLSGELNQSIDANLKVNGEVPIKAAKVGAEAGAGSKTSGAVAGSIVDTEERIHQATIKAANTLKTKTSSTVETSSETGLETTIKETIVNPNKCHTLTYHFFEVSEVYEVATRLDRLSPILLVPLRRPTVTPEWLLCHECLLRQHLPCETFYAGFAAAKLLLARGLLGEALGTLDSEDVAQASDVTLYAVRDVVAAYLSLKNAGLGLGAGSGAGNALQDGMNALSDRLNEASSVIGDMIDGVADAGGTLIQGVLDAGAQVAGALSGMFAGATGGGSNGANTPTFAFMAMQVAHSPGGIGSFLYWRVASIAAPELGTALSGLEQAYQGISGMPAGPTKVDAVIGALQTFFTTLGDIDDVFRRIDTGLAVVAGAIAAGTIGGAAIAAGLIAATGVVSIPVAVAMLGAGAMVALTELAVVVGSFIVDGTGLADVLPDDRGLAAMIGGLYGFSQQLGRVADLPLPPQSDDPADTAAYQQALLEAKERRRELADAQVELARLTCHVNENISYYNEVYWSTLPSADLERVLHDEFHIPPHVVEPKIVGFDGGKAALRVTDPRWLGMSDVDVARAMAELHDLGLLDATRQKSEIVMPTPGMTVEPELGSCNACDDFVQFHRARDMELKTEEVEQTRLETQRLQERLNRGLLGDPTPYEGAASVSVSVTGEPDGVTSIGGGGSDDGN